MRNNNLIQTLTKRKVLKVGRQQNTVTIAYDYKAYLEIQAIHHNLCKSHKMLHETWAINEYDCEGFYCFMASSRLFIRAPNEWMKGQFFKVKFPLQK